MSTGKGAHILENRIIQIIADGGTQADEQAHLERCEHCRAALTDLQVDLERLRRQAVRATPAPAVHLVLPADPSERLALHRRRFGWAVLGALLSATLVILFLLQQIYAESR